MSRPAPPTYKTRSWPAYNEALKRRGSLTIWFDPGMSWDAAPSGRRGCQRTYSDAAIDVPLDEGAVRHGTPADDRLRRGLPRLVGLDWTVPDFSTLSRRQKTLAVNIPYRGSKGPLHLLIDIEPVSATGSSEPARGIKVEGEGEWTEEGQPTVRGTVGPTKVKARRHETTGLAQDPPRD